MRKPVAVALLVAGLSWCTVLLPGGRVAAQDGPDIEIGTTGRSQLKIAVFDAGGGGDATLSQQVASRDFDISGLFKVLNPGSFVHLKAEHLATADPQNWRAVGAQAISKVQASGSRLEFKLFLTHKGPAAVLQRSYPGGASTRASTHRWCNEVVKLLSGEDGIFGTEIAMSGGGQNNKNIYVVGVDGHGLRRITNGKLNILPSWAPGGGSLLFTTYAHLNPDLYRVPAGGGKARRVSSYPGLNSGGVYSPDGSRIAVTLSRDGNSEIYILSPSGSILKRLTNHPGIDSSPSWSPDGSKIAFVSDRQGGPQIYVVSASGGAPKRVTWKGSYNTTPAWSPRRDVQQIAFTGRDERSNFDVFILDVATGNISRVTQGRGSRLEPTWAPNGRMLAYVGSGGLYTNTVDGNWEKRVVAGRYQTPAWGPKRN